MDNVSEEKTRIELWERKLLDLGLRNTLINMRMSRTVIPVLTDSADSIEDVLFDGEDLSILPKPEDWIRSSDELNFDNIHELHDKIDLIREEFRNKKLRSSLTNAELQEKLKNLHRKARTAMEENGANTLYIALGLLRWYEYKKSPEPRYAPILLVPIEIIRKSAALGYVIRKRDEDTQLNITLLEKLKQDFDLKIEGLTPLPEDEHGIDCKAVFSVVSEAIKEQKGWDVLESACVGMFSFSQFVMWNDLKNRTGDLKKNKIVNSLMEGRLTFEGENMDPDLAEEDTEELLMPMSVDGSQGYAVSEASKGKSFILHGPPGTGKSQTITVMIANALYHGKTVLFVAEKMAALEVVEKRLKAIGLGPFCLELHSNKAKKKEVLSQLNESLEVKKDSNSEEYERKKKRLKEVKEKLDVYAEELHKRRNPGLSLYDMINRYEDHKAADDVSVQGFNEKDTDEVSLEKMNLAVERLISAGRAAGHPGGHSLYAIGVKDYSQGLRDEIAADAEDYRGKALRLKDIVKEAKSEKELSDLFEKEEKYEKALELEKDLKTRWNPDFFKLDAPGMLYEYNTVNAKWFIPKYFGMNSLVKRFIPYAATTIDKDKLGQDLAKYSEYSRLLEESGGKSTEGYLNAYKEFSAAKDKFYTAGEIRSEGGDGDFLSKEASLCDGILSSISGLREWVNYNHAAYEAEELGLKPFVDAYSGGMDHDMVKEAFLKALYKGLSVSIINENETLSRFSGTLFDENVERFRELDKEITELTRELIFCALAKNVPESGLEAAKNPEIGTLQKAIKSNGRGLSIRRLMDKIPNLLPRLCPCMLMSPISAAQYLDPAREPFDLVIFDEASQMPTSKAVGVLSRGKDAVIVGDPKQMPPTTFFASEQLDEENLEDEDLESILDDCLALNMSETHLKWHYRSRHESLIAFSNKEFYGNKLYTFPSVNDRESMVTLTPVNGFFERAGKRINRAEAEAVVDEIKRRYSDPDLKEKSIGVVTFNINQQNLIEDLLNDVCAEDESFETWMYKSEEPIFIKNLENVQGDERDVILFSVAYGPDESGKVYMNFGPLNKEGGWRRLNVAVTRARCEMKVFSSMSGDDIDMKRTSAEGVNALKHFLEYAAGKREFLNDAPRASENVSSGGIAGKIKAFLNENGYEADLGVGSSEFKVDVGVIDPADRNNYILGILLDGDSYKAAKTTRDRELSQTGLLKGLGWNIARIWTMDWYDDPDRELGKILSLLKDQGK